ncbi:hypothetical protein A2U01_0053153, partial [Trifolium medium]|nr:hypothetical protein [Trifolium medium]
AQVLDETSARMEEEEKIRKDPKMQGKTRVEMGLNEFTGTVIKSVLAGLEITISRAHIAKILGIEDYGKRISDYKSDVYYRQSIRKELYTVEQSAGKANCM